MMRQTLQLDTDHHVEMNQQQQQLEELTVVKAELTGGDTSGLVYVRRSAGAAFLVTPRKEALREVEKKIEVLNDQEGEKKR